MSAAAGPTVGVFDSGIGGFSVLRALRKTLPAARFVYLADSAFAPYGERASTELLERLTFLVPAWRARHRLDAIVLACNTATAIAIDALRTTHFDLPIVGVEPALKPALTSSTSKQVGVVATRATLQSARYAALRTACLAAADAATALHEQACDGLAGAIERGDDALARTLCRHHLGALLQRAPLIDTLVLGCTHYPLVLDAWNEAAGRRLRLVDPAEAVARRTCDLLGAPFPGTAGPPPLLLTTGEPETLSLAATRWLSQPSVVQVFTAH